MQDYKDKIVRDFRSTDALDKLTEAYMRVVNQSLNEDNKETDFNGREAQKIYYDAFRKLNDGFDTLNKTLRMYFEKSGKKNEFDKKINLKELRRMLDKVETQVSSTVVNMSKRY